MRTNEEGVRFENEEEENVYLESSRTRRSDLLMLYDAITGLLSYAVPTSGRDMVRADLRRRLLRIRPEEDR